MPTSVTIASEQFYGLEGYLVDKGADGTAGGTPRSGDYSGPSLQRGDGLVEGHHDRPGGDRGRNREVQLPVLPGAPWCLKRSDSVTGRGRRLPDGNSGDDGQG